MWPNQKYKLFVYTNMAQLFSDSMCSAVCHRWGPHLEFCEDRCNIWSTQREEGVPNLLKGVKASIHLGSNLSPSSHHLPVNILSFRNKLLQLLHLLPQLSPHNLDKMCLKFGIEASTFYNSSSVQQVKLELKTKPVLYLYTLSVNPCSFTVIQPEAPESQTGN